MLEKVIGWYGHSGWIDFTGKEKGYFEEAIDKRYTDTQNLY